MADGSENGGGEEEAEDLSSPVLDDGDLGFTDVETEDALADLGGGPQSTEGDGERRAKQARRTPGRTRAEEDTERASSPGEAVAATAIDEHAPSGDEASASGSVVADDNATAGAASPGARDPDMPSAVEYMFVRWEEMLDSTSPWWTKGHGIGLRLRLRELLDIADARNEGATQNRLLNDLQAEARAILQQEEGFLRRWHEPTADELLMALKVEKEGALGPQSLSYSIVGAAFEQLRGVKIITAIVDELQILVDGATNASDLLALDDYIELLDAEFAYDGHSVAWRCQVVSSARVAFAAGSVSMAKAVLEAAEHLEEGWPLTLRFVIPVNADDRQQQVLKTHLRDAEDLKVQLGLWTSDDLPSEFSLTDDGAFVLEVEKAADIEAGRMRANEWLEQELALWRLQGGAAEPVHHWIAIDETGTVHAVERPAAMDLLPSGLMAMEDYLNREPAASNVPDGRRSTGRPALADAFLQLAQARSSAPGAVISDLWTVTEAVFAGAAEERGFQAGEVMAELLAALYPQELLGWMADRFAALGVTPSDGQSADAVWMLDRLASRFRPTLRTCSGDKDPLLWVRVKHFGGWSGKPADSTKAAAPSRRMPTDLDAIVARAESIAARAYLVRNFQVHRAQPNRATALRVTLPVFAGMVRTSLGFVASDEEATKEPVTSVKLFKLRIRQVAYGYTSARATGAGPLRDVFVQRSAA